MRRITLIALLWLIFVNPGSITNLDTERRMQMAHAWWTRTSERIPGDSLVIRINDRNYVPYDFGQSILMLPGDWLGTKLGQNLNFTNQHERRHFTEAIVSFLIFVPLNLLAVLACSRILQLFDYPQKLAELSSIIWLLGTSVLFYSSFHQQNNQILLFVLLSYQTALAYVIRAKKRLALLSGITLGIAFLIRITSILYLVSVLVFLVGCLTNKYKLKPLSSSLKALGLWMTGFIPFVLLERILTFYRYGSWTETSSSLHLQVYNQASSLIEPNAIAQGKYRGFAFLGHLKHIQLEALLAPLFSPEKSIFLYDPLVLPCLILSLVCWKFLSIQIKWYLIAGILCFLLHLYIYSWTSNWITDGVWGARYHLTSIHLLLIPLIPLLVRGATRGIKKTVNLYRVAMGWFTKIIIVLAIVIQFASISLHFSLEATQQTLGIGSRFHIVQRFDNIFYKIAHPNLENMYPEIEDSATVTALKNKMNWDLLPFLYQSEENSALGRFAPLWFGIWGGIFVFAAIATIRMFL